MGLTDVSWGLWAAIVCSGQRSSHCLREMCSIGQLGRSSTPSWSLSVRAWQHACIKICTLSCTFRSWCWTDKEGGQRREIKCHNESKRHNSFWSNALRDESCSGEPLWPRMAPQQTSRDWRAHINSNYSQRMRFCKWLALHPTLQMSPQTFCFSFFFVFFL